MVVSPFFCYDQLAADTMGAYHDWGAIRNAAKFCTRIPVNAVHAYPSDWRQRNHNDAGPTD